MNKDIINKILQYADIDICCIYNENTNCSTNAQDPDYCNTNSCNICNKQCSWCGDTFCKKCVKNCMWCNEPLCYWCGITAWNNKSIECKNCTLLP